MIELTRNPIDPATVTEQARRPDCGAVLLFLGTVRDLTEGRQTIALDYEAYAEMAEKQLQNIEEEVRRRWTIGALVLCHRLGHLSVGEISVAVAVSSPHRADAFAACRFAMEEIKRTVPIWKKENWADGTSEWVHPPDSQQIS